MLAYLVVNLSVCSIVGKRRDAGYFFVYDLSEYQR